MPIANCIDAYKADHRRQYPDNSELVFSNWTPRSSRMFEIDYAVLFTLQAHIKRDLIGRWNNEFFKIDKNVAISRYRRRLKNAGINIDYTHMEQLHDLGYLPITIMALPEGTKVPIGVPMFIMWNTLPEFAWVVNYLETKLSSAVWHGCTSATTANWYREELDYWCQITGGNPDFVQFQGHDFSYRGLDEDAAMASGGGHLCSFVGTDTFPAIDYLEDFYFADSDTELVGCSVPATEHSVMCMGGNGEDEFETFRRLITEVYPSGIVSIVSDTWDYWKVVTEYLPRLKDEIMARDGTVTIRPDSGDPVKIIVGDPDAPVGSPEYKGSMECLWETFGGTVNEKGFRQIDSHINLIYGDSITRERARQICGGLAEKKIVPSMILGIGSFTYQYVTRDNLGFAMKATYGVVGGVGKELFKDPKTDNGMKKSAKGLLAVFRDENGKLYCKQSATWEEVFDCEFRIVFQDGMAYNEQSLAEIRELMAKNRRRVA